jgi:hypothetical protein
VRQLGADVGVELARRQKVQIVRETLPAPGQAFGEHGEGDVLHPLHQADQPVMVFRAAGRKADAAIAHDHRRAAMQGGRADRLAPGRLAVIMGVNVDKAGRHDLSARVDLLDALAGNLADGGDLAAGDRHVAFERCGARAVHDCPAADNQVAASPWFPPLSFPAGCQSRRPRESLTARQQFKGFGNSGMRRAVQPPPGNPMPASEILPIAVSASCRRFHAGDDQCPGKRAAGTS